MTAATDEHLVDRVRAALAGLRQVKEKKMFGGTGFMVRGNLCVTAALARSLEFNRTLPSKTT